MIILKGMSIQFMKATDVLETIHDYTGNIFKEAVPAEFSKLSELAPTLKKPPDTGQKWWKKKFTDDILTPLNNKNNLNIHSSTIAGPKLKKLAGTKSLITQSDVVYIKKHFIDSESNRFMCLAFTETDIINDEYPEIVDVYRQLNDYSKSKNINTINIQSHLSVIIYEPKPPVAGRGDKALSSTIKKPLQFLKDPDRFIYFYKTHKYHSPSTPYIDSIIYIPIYALNYDVPTKSIIYFDKQITDSLFPQKETIVPSINVVQPTSVSTPKAAVSSPMLLDGVIIASSNPYDFNQYLHVVSFASVKGKFLQGRSKFDISDKTQFNLYSYETKRIVGVIEYNKEESVGSAQSVSINWCSDYDLITV